jgi:hypothetical protein
MTSKTSGSPKSAKGADPLLGTWKLNLAKSDYSQVPMYTPRSITRTFLAPREGELRFTVDEVTAVANPVTGLSSGASIHIEWGGKYDGKDYPATGAIGYDSVAVKRSIAGALEWTFKKGGKLFLTATSSVSRDGKTLTITWTGKNQQGKTITVLHVYDKELAG